MNDEFVERRRSPVLEGWHLDKKVPLSLIVAMVVQIVAVVWFFADIKKDIEILKSDVTTLHVRDTSIEQQTKEYIKSINENLARVDAKLDRLIERQK